MKKIALTDRIRKQAINFGERCSGCNLCMQNCPMLSSFCDTPKTLLQEIGIKGEVNPSLAYSCCLCDYCSQVCPRGIDMKALFFEMRQHQFQDSFNSVKKMGYWIVKSHQKNSFSKLFRNQTNQGDVKENKRAFFPGCSLMAYSPELVMKTYGYLKNIYPNIELIVNCCGNPTHAIGDSAQFNEYYKTLEEQVEKTGIEELIVACPNCYQMISTKSPELKVTSIWLDIAKLGVPETVKGIGENLNISFAIHDPCPTRKETEIHEAVREILREIGVNIQEFKLCREKTLCCGAGGMVGITNKPIAMQQMQKRANQTTAPHIVSYCESCVESMIQGGKKAVHLLDLIFDETLYKRNTFNQRKETSLKKWVNRYRMKQRVNKL